MSLLVFVDDLQPNKIAGRRWCGYGGVVIEDEHLPRLDSKIEKLKDSYKFPTRLPYDCKSPSLEEYREIKYSPARDQWMRDNLAHPKRGELFEKLLNIVTEINGKFLLSFYDESSDGCGIEIAKGRALENFYERIGGMTKTETDVVIIICDLVGSHRETKRLIQHATGIARFGTWYRKDIHEGIYPVLLTAESHMHAGLQIADVVIGALRGMLGDEDQYAPPIWREIVRRLYKSGNRQRGWGVKLRSKDSGRLYEKLGV